VKTILTLWITYFSIISVVCVISASDNISFFSFGIGHMKAVLHSLGLLSSHYAAFSNCFHKYLLKYHPKLISFAFLSKQEPQK